MARKKKPSTKKSLKNADVGSKLTRNELCERIYEEIWPVDRNVLFRPERLRYVRKLIKPTGCVFCTAADQGPSKESLCIYKDDRAMVVLNKFPYNAGHLLVLPRRHEGEFLNLAEDESAAIHRCLRTAVEALQDAYKPAGFNVGLNLGSAAGAGIPEHLHYHLVPRWNGDTNFFALIAETKVVVESLEQTYDRLLPYFSGR